MPQVVFIEPDGTERALEVPVGISVMLAAVEARVRGIEATCLGDCVCSTCHVYVSAADAGRLPPPSEEELETLENVVAEQNPNSRLSCQIFMAAGLGGLRLQVPPNQ